MHALGSLELLFQAVDLFLGKYLVVSMLKLFPEFCDFCFVALFELLNGFFFLGVVDAVELEEDFLDAVLAEVVVLDLHF